MAFVLELTAFSHHDDGDILERHSLLSDPNAENVAIFRNTVAEALEMGGFLTGEHAEFDNYSRTHNDQETYAIGLKVNPTHSLRSPTPSTWRSRLTASLASTLVNEHPQGSRPRNTSVSCCSTPCSSNPLLFARPSGSARYLSETS